MGLSFSFMSGGKSVLTAMLPHSLLFFYIYGSCSLSVIHQLHILEALNILLKLGKSVIPYLKIPELHPDPVTERSRISRLP